MNIMSALCSNKCHGKVLVLGNDNRSFLTVIRSLGRKNICVHVGWCAKNLYALKSRYISKVHEIPGFSLDNDHWKTALIDLLKSERFDLVVPCNDSTIIPLQTHRVELEKHARLYLLDDDCYRIANDKFEMQKLAGRLGINVAEELTISKGMTAAEIVSALRLPVVIKPRASYTKEKISQKDRVLKIYDEKGLGEFLSKVRPDESYVAQRNFIGKGAGVEIIAKQGRILVAFQHVRIHEPLTGGGSSYRMSVYPFEPLLEASKKIIGALKYTGVAMIEYKFNDKTQDWIFIEINARFWGSLPLPVACGIDFPYYLYCMIVEGKTRFNPYYKAGVYCRNTSNDARWMVDNLKADRKDPTLATRPLHKVAMEIFNVFFFNERNDTLVLDDFKPGLCEIKGVVGYYWKTGLRKILERVANLPHLRHIRKKRACSRIARAESLLFVCKGNICRSPFAHYYLSNKNIPGLCIDSCGYYPKENRLCPQEAVSEAAKFDVDLFAHRSKVINDELIRKADVVLVFDWSNYIAVRERYSFAVNKILFVSAFDEKSSVEIKDPYGSDTEMFFSTYGKIAGILDRVEIALSKR